MKEGLSMSPLRPASFFAYAYLLVALGIYFWVQDFIDIGSINFPKSMENIFWLLVATGLGFGFIAEGILLVKHRQSFCAVAPGEICKSDLIKAFINFLLTLLFSWVIYLFVITRQPYLKDPLAFISVAAMVYIATATLCRNIRYIPIIFIFLRRKYDHL